MIARAIENLFYTAAVTGTHRALTEMGMIATDAPGTPAEQIRSIVGPPAQTPAIENGDGETGGKKSGRSKS
jgi:hypothetical protein